MVPLSMRGPWVVSVGLGWALRRSWVGGRHSFTKVYIDKLPIHRHRAAATRKNYRTMGIMVIKTAGTIKT